MKCFKKVFESPEVNLFFKGKKNQIPIIWSSSVGSQVYIEG
jgi:hypothetical protein